MRESTGIGQENDPERWNTGRCALDVTGESAPTSLTTARRVSTG